MSWHRIAATVVQGHRVASGANHNPLFPGGTLRMQIPYFQQCGLDLSSLHPATVNVNIAPLRYRALRGRHTFRAVRWHPTEPAEDFSFFDCRLIANNAPPVSGFVYYPHPETKPRHFQQPDILELVLPWVDSLDYESRVFIEIDPEQIAIEGAASISEC